MLGAVKKEMHAACNSCLFWQRLAVVQYTSPTTVQPNTARMLLCRHDGKGMVILLPHINEMSSCKKCSWLSMLMLPSHGRRVYACSGCLQQTHGGVHAPWYSTCYSSRCSLQRLLQQTLPAGIWHNTYCSCSISSLSTPLIEHMWMHGWRAMGGCVTCTACARSTEHPARTQLQTALLGCTSGDGAATAGDLQTRTAA